MYSIIVKSNSQFFFKQELILHEIICRFSHFLAYYNDSSRGH